MIETLFTFFAFGTIWFWLLAFIVSIIFIASIENDHYTLPTIIAIILGILFWKPIMAFSWQTLSIVVAGYALAGVIWSVFKWYRHVHKKVASYCEKYGDTLTGMQKVNLELELSVSANKARLTGWISWWPWNLTWSLTGDFFNMLYDTMTTAYQRIADRAIGNFKVEEEPKAKTTKEIITNSDRNYNKKGYQSPDN